MWRNYDKQGKWKRRGYQSMKSGTQMGTVNAYMCVQGRERAKNWSQCVFLRNGWTPTVSLKDIPESLILKIHNIVGIYASKFFVVNIEHFSPITIFMNGKMLSLSCVSVDLYWKLAFIILF